MSSAKTPLSGRGSLQDAEWTSHFCSSGFISQLSRQQSKGTAHKVYVSQPGWRAAPTTRLTHWLRNRYTNEQMNHALDQKETLGGGMQENKSGGGG